MTLPAWKADDAAVRRALKTDSETLRYAEWWVRKRLYGLSDQEARWLYQRYMDGFKEMVAALATSYDRDDRLNIARRQALLQQIEAEMDALVGDVERHLFETEMDAFRQGYYGRAWELDMATLPDVRINTGRLPVEAIRASVLTPYLGVQWGETLQLARDEFVLRVKRSITQSIIGGESMAQAQRRLRDELGIPTDRRKGFTQNFYRTLLIARTEIMRASNLGAVSIYEQNQDILSGWEWVVARDGRTCPECQALDGKRYKFSERANVPPSGSHPGCRCTAVPVLIDEALMDRVTGGPRETYADWATKQNVPGLDGGLTGQKTAGAHGLNTVTKTAPPVPQLRPMRHSEEPPRWERKQQGPEYLENQARDWYKGLSEDEKAAFDYWSSKEGFYNFNDYVRGKTEGWTDEQRQDTARRIKAFDETLAKSPKTREVLYRGISRSDLNVNNIPAGQAALMEEYSRKIGTVEEWPAYSSASLNPRVAHHFATGRGLSAQALVYEIESTQGHYVNPASQFSGVQGQAEIDELEAIFPPGSRFRVTGVRVAKIYDEWLNYYFDQVIVTVEEIE